MTASSWMVGGVDNLVDLDSDGRLDLIRAPVSASNDMEPPLRLEVASIHAGKQATPKDIAAVEFVEDGDTWCLRPRRRGP